MNGDAKDRTPWSGHGEVFGATSITDRFGRPNSAYDFNGTSDYIALDKFFNSAGALPEFAVAAWVKVNPGEGDWAVLDFDRSEYFTATISGNVTTTNKAGFHTNSSGGSIHDMSGSIDVADGSWRHVVWQYDGTDKVIYVDGIEDARVANPHSGLAIGSGVTRYGIIGDGSEATSFNGARNSIHFDGQISDLRFYDRALSAEEVKMLQETYR